MLFKRYLFLTALVLLFIIAYIGGFAYVNASMETHFRDERVQAGVEGTVLTASDKDKDKASAPDSSSGSQSAPAPIGSQDKNVIIGPVPPGSPSSADSSAAAPGSTDMNSAPAAPASDTNSAPATPAAPDSNAAPTTPPSTMNYPRESGSPFLVLAAYHPTVQGASIEPIHSAVAPTPAAPITAPAPSGTNTEIPTTSPTNSAASTSPATNGAPVSGTNAAGNARPVPVEASVIVLLYHQFVPAGASVSPKLQWTLNDDVFEEEMKYIHDNGYHVVPMSDLVKFLKHEIGLPPNSVVITIDDGYKSAIVHAAPILKKYGYPWTFFVYPEFITVNEGAGAASWNDLLALQADGVDIESHSMTHPTLTKHSQKIKGVWRTLSPEEYDQWLTNETSGSKALLEQKLGKPITCFAYPYGAYNKEVEAKAIAAGYDAIFTVADNPVRSNTDIHSIGRYTITRAVVKNFTAYLRQGALGLAEAYPAPGATIADPRPVITAVLGYTGTLNASDIIETSVRDFGVVKHDFDPQTSTVRLYLPRDLIQPVNLVNIRVKDSQTGQIMVANWHFNFEPAGGTTHAPIAPSSTTNTAPVSTNSPAAETNVTPASTNAPTPAASPETNAAPASARASATTPAPSASKEEPASKSSISSKSH